MTKIVILDIFCIFLLIFRNEDKILLCELFLCSKMEWNRAASEILTVLYCPNQFEGPENSNIWLRIVIFIFFFCYLRYCTAESRPGGEHLLKISEIFHISNPSFQVHETRKNCLKFVSLVVFYFCCHFEFLKWNS